MKFLSDKEIRNGDLEGLEVETDTLVLIKSFWGVMTKI